MGVEGVLQANTGLLMKLLLHGAGLSAIRHFSVYYLSSYLAGLACYVHEGHGFAARYSCTNNDQRMTLMDAPSSARAEMTCRVCCDMMLAGRRGHATVWVGGGQGQRASVRAAMTAGSTGSKCRGILPVRNVLENSWKPGDDTDVAAETHADFLRGFAWAFWVPEACVFAGGRGDGARLTWPVQCFEKLSRRMERGRIHRELAFPQDGGTGLVFHHLSEHHASPIAAQSHKTPPQHHNHKQNTACRLPTATLPLPRSPLPAQLQHCPLVVVLPAALLSARPSHARLLHARSCDTPSRRSTMS